MVKTCSKVTITAPLLIQFPTPRDALDSISAGASQINDLFDHNKQLTVHGTYDMCSGLLSN